MKKIIFSIALALSSTFAFSAPAVKESEESISIKLDAFHKAEQCLNTIDLEFYNTHINIASFLKEKEDEVKKNPKLYKDKTVTEAGKKEIAIATEQVAKMYSDSRLQYVAKIAECMSIAKNLDLNEIVNEKLRREGHKPSKGII